MGVVRREALRRWSVVGAGVVVLCLLPAAVGAWPVSTPAGLAPAELRTRILGSADQPYQGYAETDGRLGLPVLPGLAELAEVRGLLGGSSRIRAWYAGPRAWRVAELTLTGERDTYRAAPGVYRWDFERDQVTLVTGELDVWPPGAADVVPPALARRLLAADGRLERLPSRRVAGVGAAGVRLVPSDPGTTVGRVDVWADPDTGLPVRVEVAGRDGAGPAFISRFLELRRSAPDPAVVRPTVPTTVDFTVTSATSLGEAVAAALPGRLPGTLAGRERVSSRVLPALAGAAVYGTGFGSVAVVALPGRAGGRAVAAAREAGGTPIPIAGAEAYQLRSSLLTAVVVHADQSEEPVHAWLLAGLVDPGGLADGATELVDRA